MNRVSPRSAPSVHFFKKVSKRSNRIRRCINELRYLLLGLLYMKESSTFFRE